MQVILITQGSTVGHTAEELTLFLKELGYAVFKAESHGGPQKFIVSHPNPTWVPALPDLVTALNSQPNYIYMAEVFEVQ